MKSTRILSIIALLVAITSMLACSSVEIDKTQTPAIKSASTSVVDGMLGAIPFITLRNVTGSNKPADFFGGDRNAVHTGLCDVSYTLLKTLKPLATREPSYILENKVNLDAIREFNNVDFWRYLKKSTNGHRPILYLHGFNISFNRGCKRAALFQENLGLDGRLVLFSWPSNGAALSYTRAESDLYWSVLPLQETINNMIEHFGAGGFDIVAHSLGTRGIFFALVQWAHGKHDAKPLLNQLVLIAPDIDAGIFKQYLPQIQPLAQNITIYVSGNDSLLALSREVHDYPRLGESGLHLQNIAGVDIIEITNACVSSPSGHIYHLYQNIMASDLAKLLNDGQAAARRSTLKQMSENHWQLQPQATDKQTDNCH